MKKRFYTIALLSIGYLAFGQVGIGTNTPATTLDVVGKPTDATALDGVTVPRLTAAQLASKTYTALQNGALVFVTDATTGTAQASAVAGSGLYYFDGSTLKWVTSKGGAGVINNIYTNDGTLSGNRAVQLATNSLSFYTTSSVRGGMVFATPDNGGTTLKINAAVGTYGFNQNGNGHFAIDNSGSVGGRLMILESGNVGINTTAPLAKFQVTGPGISLPAISGTVLAAGTVARFKGSDNGTLDFGSNGGSGQWIQATDAGSLATNYALLLNPNGGNVVVGATSAGNKFEVVSTTAGTSGLRMRNLTNTVITKTAGAATLGVDINGDIVIASNAASTAAKNFIYMPSIAIDVSANVTGATKNLYSLYSAQFTTPKAASTGAPAAIPVLPAATDFYYYVTYADPAVFTGTMSIDASGILTYSVTASAVTDATFINIVLVPKN